jgi:hypothetical protein
MAMDAQASVLLSLATNAKEETLYHPMFAKKSAGMESSQRLSYVMMEILRIGMAALQTARLSKDLSAAHKVHRSVQKSVATG